MSELTERILQYLQNTVEVNTLDLAKVFNEDHQKIVGALKSIQATGDLITAEAVSEKHIELTEEGKLIAEKGIFLILYMCALFCIKYISIFLICLFFLCIHV